MSLIISLPVPGFDQVSTWGGESWRGFCERAHFLLETQRGANKNVSTIILRSGEPHASDCRNQSGKSTLLNIIGGLDRPTEGSVIIDGIELSGLDDDILTRLRREKIGFILQFFNLLPTLTALENAALPMHLSGLSRKNTLTTAGELLDLVGLQDRQDHLPDELSGGEQQRVAMARALALNPPLMLADEPIGNLDSRNGQEILALFKSLQSRFETTVLIVTHYPIAAGFCDRILRMQDRFLMNEAQ
jgi:putative ABC transport system ATP-binding protein